MNTQPNPKPPFMRSLSPKRIGQVMVVGGLLTLVLVGPLQPHVTAMRSDEGLYIPDAHYQFSHAEVTNGAKTLSHTFTLYNGRARPLHVEASANCGCTGLSWERATLPPFGRKQIVASMNSSNRSQSVEITFKVENKNYAFAQLKTEEE